MVATGVLTWALLNSQRTDRLLPTGSLRNDTSLARSLAEREVFIIAPCERGGIVAQRQPTHDADAQGDAESTEMDKLSRNGGSSLSLDRSLACSLRRDAWLPSLRRYAS